MLQVIFRALVTAGIMAAAAVASPLAVRADGGWLDQPLVQWNRPWSVAPVAPTSERDLVDPRCLAAVRPAVSESERMVRAAGWDLIGETVRGRDLEVILAASLYDGMCRPLRYQAFVYYGGLFVGTLSPGLMDSRSDGALDTVAVTAPASAAEGPGLQARFRRYQASDPLCCPSSSAVVEYRVELVNAGPVLVARRVLPGT